MMTRSRSKVDVVESMFVKQEEHELTLLSSSFSRSRLPFAVSSFPDPTSSASPVAISSNESTYNNNNISQDVLLVNPSAAIDPVQARRQTIPHNVVNKSNNVVFSTTQDLAAHYGIPQILPPAPRTTPRPSQKQSPVISDFDALKASYLNMLADKPAEPVAAATEPTPAVVATMAVDTTNAGSAGQPYDIERLVNHIMASPEFQAMHSFDSPLDTSPVMSVTSPDFMTSPLIPDDSPYEDFANSFDDSPYSDFLTTPVIQDSSNPHVVDEFDYESTGMSLFGGVSLYNPPVAAAPAKEEPTTSEDSTPPIPTIENIDSLFTMSPETPMLDSLDPSSLYHSPRLPSSQQAATAAATRRKSSATGTRKNITVASLVPLDAPTQTRKYTTPSATSRKEVPAVFARKRTRAAAFGDDDEIDELDEAQAPLAPNATEREQIEWKRRQNTLAARKSRKRKLEHQQFLEGRVAELERNVEMWKTRALTTASILHSHGVPFSFEDDEAE